MSRVGPAGDEFALVLDLHGLLAGIRWRWRLWVGLAVVGFLVGMALAVVLPGRATATATVYVAHENEQAGDRQALMQTDLAVLMTTQVAGMAAQRLGNGETPEKFLGTYSGASAAANILTITAHDDSNAAVTARAGAVAEAFITDHVKRSTDAAAASRDAYLQQRDQAAKELADVDAAIARAVPANDPNLENLYARRSSLQSNIGNFESQAAQSGIGAPRVAAGTVVLDGPRVTTRSLPVAGVIGGGLGGLLGLGLGLVLAAVLTVVGDRPVLRRDIAAHLGASVVAQVPRAARGPAALLRRLRPERTRLEVAATATRLMTSRDEGFAVLELGCRPTAVALVADMAEILAPGGPVELVDDLPGDPLAAELQRRGPDAGSGITIAGSAEATAQAGSAVRRIGVATVGPGCAWTDLPRLGSEALVVVAAGAAPTAWLHEVARQLADGEITVAGIVLVHPDPRDRTDGTLWSALHVALRGRVAPPAAEAAGSLQDGVAGSDGAQPPAASNGHGPTPANGHAPPPSGPTPAAMPATVRRPADAPSPPPQRRTRTTRRRRRPAAGDAPPTAPRTTDDTRRSTARPADHDGHPGRSQTSQRSDSEEGP